MDSGLRKTVFLDRGEGYFEPRAVETGWKFGDRVEIVRGLEAGERIVLSGNFLIDSESRMQTAARPPAAISAAANSTVKDPSCGMEVDPAKAAGKSEYNGKTYYFCSKKSEEVRRPQAWRSCDRERSGATRSVGQPILPNAT